ncbi:MAG: O-antigen ligase family protein [Candidatus Uhrbacteria bacterium]|nr:O-antigen ligase family protein [Candidatus Uhrbacteria bacterium]
MYALFFLFGAVLFALLAWRNYNLALRLLFALLPTYLIRITIGPVPTTWLEVAIVTLAIIWIYRERPTLVTVRSAFGAYFWPLVALFAVATLGIFISPDHVGALGVWKAYFIEPALLFVILRTTFRDLDWSRANEYLAWSTIAIAAMAIVQRITGLGIPAPWDVEMRVTSIFDFPNAVGLFLAPLVVYFIVLIWHFRTRDSIRLFGGAALLSLVAIVLAQTEAALVAIPAALLIVFLFTTRSAKYRQWAIAGGTLLLVLAFLMPDVREKLQLRDYSGNVRRAQWSETLDMLADRPVFGAGLSGYPSALEPYHDGTLYEIFQYPHMLVLNIWTELGLLGLFSFVWLALVCLQLAYKNHASLGAVAAFAALLAMTIHGLVDVPYFKNDLAILTWFLLAALITAPTLTAPVLAPVQDQRP